MKCRYAVTFEFEVQAPITHRGTVAATTMPTCFARAARQATKAHPGLRWSSLVVVLLERLDVAAPAAVRLQPGADRVHGEVNDGGRV